MAADNVKTAFCLPSEVNQDFIRNMGAPPTTTKSKNINQQQQNINQFISEGVSKYTQETTCAEASF